MRVSFDFTALHYLNLWLRNERQIYDGIHAEAQEEQLLALRRAAAEFRIARSFPTKCDEGIGLKRFEPVLDTINSVSASSLERNVVGVVADVCRQLGGRYGGRNVLSATTKFLWVRFRSPIVIYDRQARLALGTADGDFPGYWMKWHESYAAVRNEIADACSRLVDVRAYTVCERMTT